MTVESQLVETFQNSIRNLTVPEMRSTVQRFFTQYRHNSNDLFDMIKLVWKNSHENSDRMAIALLSGFVGVEIRDCVLFLRNECCKDKDWRVQEMIAKGFTQYCESTGWEKVISEIEEWMIHSNENTRRAAAEGPRIWTKRAYFDKHPEEAIRLLGMLRDDNSLYVRKSVANSLSDISKAHPDLLVDSLMKWTENMTENSKWIIKNACRSLLKLNDQKVSPILKILKDK